MTEENGRRGGGLDETMLRRLETYHKRILRFLLYQVDDEFRLRPFPESDWLLLGDSLIELLRVSDARSFEMIIQGIAHGMIKSEPPNHPHVASAMARAGMTDNQLFKESLEAIADASRNDGAMPFGSKILGKGDLFATLFSLQVLWISGKASEHQELIGPALDFMESKADDLLRGSPEILALLMTTMLRYRQDAGMPLAGRCLDALLGRQTEQGDFENSPAALGINGETAAALLEAAHYFGRRAAGAAERWLKQAFGLDQEREAPEWPQSFLRCQSEGDAEAWMDQWLKAALAASRYLKDQRPGHNPAGHLLALSIYQDNLLARTEEMLKLARPYLPDLAEIQGRAPLLNLFWSGSAYEKNVLILCEGGGGQDEKPIVEAVKEALWEKGLVGRHHAEGGKAYGSNPLDDATVFMTGCRNGIVLLLKDGDQGATDPALPFQAGFMRGQGAKVLILLDRDRQAEGWPGVSQAMEGIEHRRFDSSEKGLAGLRDAVSQWGAGLA